MIFFPTHKKKKNEAVLRLLLQVGVGALFEVFLEKTLNFALPPYITKCSKLLAVGEDLLGWSQCAEYGMVATEMSLSHDFKPTIATKKNAN